MQVGTHMCLQVLVSIEPTVEVCADTDVGCLHWQMQAEVRGSITGVDIGAANFTEYLGANLLSYP